MKFLDKKKAREETRWMKKCMTEAKELYLNEKYLRALKNLFKKDDSKHIVDRATKRPIGIVLDALEKLDEDNLEEIEKFVDEYLHEPGYEITEAPLTDWKQVPSFVKNIKNEDLKSFTIHLHEIWRKLYKKIDYSKLCRFCVSSHLPMKHPFIVPGGRFIEMYYWDSYWTMEGLLICGMFDTARLIIENFIFFIENYGFIPNGTRIYYLNRSQPPYFPLMVEKYYNMSVASDELTKMQKFKIKRFILDKVIHYMIKEYEFWMMKRSVNIFINDKKEFRFNIFKANTNKPRPESYYEDIHTAENYENEDDKMKLFTDIASGCESGYDFSSRWFKDPMLIETIHTSDIIPVDLNAVLYRNEKIIAKFLYMRGEIRRARKFVKRAIGRKKPLMIYYGPVIISAGVISILQLNH